ncbi:MAG: glycosyltransferase family 39 protein [Pseudomonadota bacterium]
MGPNTIIGRDWLIGFLLFLGTFVVLGLAQRNLGVMRDEAAYFQAGERYWGWFSELEENLSKGKLGESFSKQNITKYWAQNNEHPVLFKTLFGVSWRLFHDCTKRTRDFHLHREKEQHKTLGLLSEISSFRLPGWLFTALAVMVIYFFGVRIESRMAGLAAALLYITMPRTFFHGQLACFDSGVTTFWLLVVYGYFRSLEKARWGIYLGVLFGLALAAKHNAWFIPFLLLLHYLYVIWPDLSLRPFRPFRIPLGFVAMGILGPLVFWAHWPWLWFDTINHLKFYFGFHLHHSFYNMEYLGRNWGDPPLPISYPFGMMLFTAPTIMLVLALIGVGIYFRRPLNKITSRFFGARPMPYADPFRFPARRSWLRPGLGLNPRIGTLLFMNAIFPMVLIALPWTPIFGGTKHFMTGYPFFALLAGIGVSRAACVLRDRRIFARSALLVLCVLVALPGALNTYLTHPFGLSQYNALAGGPAGGADLGLNRQFWGYAPRQLLAWMNDTFEDGAQVYFHDTNYHSYIAYIRDGLLRPDIKYAGMELPAIRNSTYALVVHELHFNKYDYWIWDTYGTVRPIKVLTLDGVPLVSVYERKSGKR